jgi:hypothetical protein
VIVTDRVVDRGSYTVVYLAGEGRSGSTIVERILSQQAGFVSVGELRNVFRFGLRHNERCGCGSWFSECEFWTQIGMRAFGGWDADEAELLLKQRAQWTRQRYLPSLIRGGVASRPGRELQPYADAFAKLYDAVAEATGARVLVDASKEPVHALTIARLTDVDLRPIHLVRDPRGVAYSWAKRGVERPNANAPERSTIAVIPPIRSARAWNRKQLWSSVLRHQSPWRSLISYEEFAQAPTTTLRRALDEVGLPPEGLQGQGSNEFELGWDHALCGNPNRFRTGAIEVSADDAWRDAMPRRQQFAVGQITLPVRALLAAERLAGRHH